MRDARLTANRITAGLSALLAVSIAAPAFAAFGAFAYDETTGRYGYSWNKATHKEAEEAALKGCTSEKCKVVFRTGAGQCGAIATTGTGKVWGGATRPNREAAEKAALENCQKQGTAGAECKVRGVECNKK